MNGLSLFACGGISEYYFDEKSKVNICVANELLEKRCKFYKTVYPNNTIIQGDITDKKVYDEIIKVAKEKNVEFIIATPPCQSFSVAGKMDKNKDDLRSFLFMNVLNAIRDLKPKYILIENVVKFMNATIKQDSLIINIRDIIDNFCKKEGYSFDTCVLDAKDYGTPQSRKRSITLISRDDVNKWVINVPKKKIITVMETIGHLKSLESGEYDGEIKWHKSKKHNERHIRWIKHTPSGKSAFENEIHFPQKECGTRIKGYSTTYKRITWDKPSPTITMANGSISSQNNCHPGRDNGDGTFSDARVLTIHELVLLNGLDEYWIPNSVEYKDEKLLRDLIGESFPPKFCKSIVDTLPL